MKTKQVQSPLFTGSGGNMEEDSPNRPKRTKVLDIIMKVAMLVANLLVIFGLR